MSAIEPTISQNGCLTPLCSPMKKNNRVAAAVASVFLLLSGGLSLASGLTGAGATLAGIGITGVAISPPGLIAIGAVLIAIAICLIVRMIGAYHGETCYINAYTKNEKEQLDAKRSACDAALETVLQTNLDLKLANKNLRQPKSNYEQIQAELTNIQNQLNEIEIAKRRGNSSPNDETYLKGRKSYFLNERAAAKQIFDTAQSTQTHALEAAGQAKCNLVIAKIDYKDAKKSYDISVKDATLRTEPVIILKSYKGVIPDEEAALQDQ